MSGRETDRIKSVHLAWLTRSVLLSSMVTIRFTQNLNKTYYYNKVGRGYVARYSEVAGK
jgi:hypothetical protein